MKTLYFSGANVLMRPFVRGVGAILTLASCAARSGPTRFQPNRLLEVTPEFLERVVRYLRRRRLDLVSLDEMYRRLVEGDSPRRFVCITIDDGYRDTLQWAYPILKRYDVPFAVYIPTSFPDRLGELWWLALEAVVARNSRITLLARRPRAGVRLRHASRRSATSTISSIAMSAAFRPRSNCATSCAISSGRYHVDIMEFCNELCMNWSELATLAADPLVTIGAHTVNHVMLAKVPERIARSEMEMSRSVIEASLGVRPDHLSYPVGDRTSAGPARVPHRRRARLQDRGDDAAGRAVPGAPRASDGAAAHLAQRRASAAALCARAAVGRRHRDVERLPQGRRGVGGRR